LTSIVYSPRYAIDIGLHVFPTRKYRLIHDELERRRGELPPFEFIEPAPAGWEQLALVHTSDYLEKLRTGAMTREDVAQLELPWSEEMVEGFRVMAGGTVLAGLIATGAESLKAESLKSQGKSLKSEGKSLETSDFRLHTSNFRVCLHLGGGLHHAFPNHGEGFCPFNDVAVAVRVLQTRGIRRHAIVDLDVHHGNGTAFVFQDSDDVFTFSMHQQHNYPMWKPQGSLDIGLSDGAHDATYLKELERALPRVLAHRPDCVFYLAGADPYEDDQLGGLRLSKDGLRRRDRTVVEAVRSIGVPLVITLAGGYARRIEDTVAIHTATVEEALGRD
jgi:acetoin utilization deacetylase AcuC-like enzyme